MSCEKFGFLSSRSNKVTVRAQKLNYQKITWSSVHFATKLGIAVVHHHKPECCVTILDCCAQGQGQWGFISSGNIYPDNLIISSEPLNLSQWSLVCWCVIMTCCHVRSLGSYCSRSKCRLKSSKKNCLFQISWTVEPFVIKHGIVVHHHEVECFVAVLDCRPHVQGHNDRVEIFKEYLLNESHNRCILPQWVTLTKGGILPHKATNRVQITVFSEDKQTSNQWFYHILCPLVCVYPQHLTIWLHEISCSVIILRPVNNMQNQQIMVCSTHRQDIHSGLDSMIKWVTHTPLYSIQVQ